MGLLFENEVCGRCGGSGQYSFNQVDGSRCYGCSGRKVRLTKRGAAAQAFFNKLASKPIVDIKVGDLVEVKSLTMGGAIYRYDAPVVEVDLEPKCSGYSVINGVKKDSWTVSFKTDHPKFGRSGMSAGVDHIVKQKLVGEARAEAVAKALEYQSSLTKAGVPKKGN